MLQYVDMQSRTKGFFSGYFSRFFLRIFVRAFLSVDLILFYNLPKNLIYDFQLKISSTYQHIATLRSKCAKTKKKTSVLSWELIFSWKIIDQIFRKIIK